MFLWWSSTKIVQAIWIRQKTWPPGGRGLFSLYIYIEKFKNLLSRNHWTDFNIILQKCFFGDPLPRLFKPFGFVKKHGRQGAGLIFPIYICIEKFLLVRNHWTDFNIILQKCSFWWFSTKTVQCIWIRQKTWPLGGGAYFPYISI